MIKSGQSSFIYGLPSLHPTKIVSLFFEVQLLYVCVCVEFNACELKSLISWLTINFFWYKLELVRDLPDKN